MKKRGLRRYYRNLSKVTFAEEIIVELKSGTASYDYKHIHLDGYILTKWSEIKQHIDALFNQFETFRHNSVAITVPFQLWGFICFPKGFGCQIALYVHTPNGDYDDFPHTQTDVSESPTINRKELLDYLQSKIADGYQIRYSLNCDDEPEIYIAMSNVGLPIFNHNEQSK